MEPSWKAFEVLVEGAGGTVLLKSGARPDAESYEPGAEAAVQVPSPPHPSPAAAPAAHRTSPMPPPRP